jgi:1,4-alpha-glucan branching enzyme
VNYRVGTFWSSDYRMILNTDDERFGGKNRLKSGENMNFPYLSAGWNNRPYSIMQYIPSRTALVLMSINNLKKYEAAKTK